MKHKLLFWVLMSVLFSMPRVLHADEIEIRLVEMTDLESYPNNGPRDGSSEVGKEPTRPNSFHATINGNTLSIVKQNDSIPSAQALVVNASTGGIVINQQFTNSLQEQISNTGAYVLHIETAGGALVGQFIVQ